MRLLIVNCFEGNQRARTFFVHFHKLKLSKKSFEKIY